jgi:hypothetical protein
MVGKTLKKTIILNADKNVARNRQIIGEENHSQNNYNLTEWDFNQINIIIHFLKLSKITVSHKIRDIICTHK